MPRADGGRSRRLFLDAGLVAALVAGAAFVLAANIPRPASVWPAPSLAVSSAAVARDPLDPAALRNLGIASARSGNEADADRLMELTWDRTRRDTPASLWLLVRRLSQARFDQAFAAADALLRRNADDATRERLFKLLLAAAHHDVSRPALVVRLAEAPWWRLAYMRELALVPDPTDARLVFAGLSHTPNPATAAELDAFLTRLVADKAYLDAARDWRAFSRPRHDPDAIGDLTAPPPFGWSPVAGEGASSSIENDALRVEYDGYSSPSLPARLTALPPGRYTITWRERVTGDDVRAIAVALRCGALGTVLATAAPLGSSGAARDERLDFEVPPVGCEGQSLAITALPHDRRASVSADFDHWALAHR